MSNDGLADHLHHPGRPKTGSQTSLGAPGNIYTIDLMVVTHYDTDHIGGADEVLAGTTVKRMMDHGDHKHWSRKKGKRFAEYLGAGGAQAEAIKPGFTTTIDGVTIECLASNGKTVYDEPGSAYGPDLGNDNPNSVVVLIKYKGWELYVGGDQTGVTEQRMVGKVPDVDMMLLNHHGSNSKGSNGTAFLRSLKPEVVLVSMGRNLGFKHPRAEPVKVIRSFGADLYATNFNEHSAVIIDPRFVADDDPEGFEGIVTIEVDGAAQKYQVRLDGFEKSYDVEKKEAVKHSTKGQRSRPTLPGTWEGTDDTGRLNGAVMQVEARSPEWV